jgi:glycosyltransferase involved in cell wall biosynthesis
MRLAEAFEKLARSPQLRRQMGAAGSRKVRHEYDWEKKAQRIIAVYQQAVDLEKPLKNLPPDA